MQLSCEELPYGLVSLAKTEELPDGCARDAWERFTSKYDLTEGEDKITLLSMLQQYQLEDVRTNITVWLTSLAIKVNKLKKLNHVLDEEYQITHILASLPREYSSVVEQVKIDRRTGSTLITMDEVKKRLEECYLKLKREHGWSEDEMALNVKSGNNQNKNVKKGSRGKYFKGRCNHCGKFVKSMIEHMSSNISHPGENVAHAQPSVSHEEEEIQNPNFEYESSKYPSEDPEDNDIKPAAKDQSWAQEEQIEKPTPKPWEDKKDNETIFRKYISVQEDGEEHYDMIDMEIEAQRAVRRITDHQEIVKQYQKVVRAYNNSMQDYPQKSTGGLMQDNCWLGDMLKDEKRKSQFKYKLGRLMGEYALPLPLGNFNLSNKETRRLEL